MDEVQPLGLELGPFVKHKGNKGAHVLDRECRRSDPPLAFVDGALCCEHTAAYEAGDQAPRLPWLLVYGGVF